VASFYVENFGCRATQADGAAIERQFHEHGLKRASAPTQAEIVVLNTCTVTAAADQDARAAIRRIHRQNPDCKIVVTGCYAQRAPDEIAVLPGVTQVIGNSHKYQLAEIAMSAARASRDARNLEESPVFAGPVSRFVPLTTLTSKNHSSIFVSDIFAHTELLAAPVFDAPNERTRPNLKVQDGCDNRCSFCVIPYVRGHSRSLPLSQILQEVNSLVSAGYREVVISGINLGRWGRDLLPEMWGVRSRPPAFEDLIRAIVQQTTLEKLRISSVEPMDWSEALIRLQAESSRIAKHAHVPMQSGSDTVLRRMQRKYRPWHYRDKIEKIRSAMPNAAIGADVMVGFPGETDAEFNETVRMIESLPFTYLHVFTYSPRPGTPAAGRRDQVPVHAARERNRILRDIAAEKKLAFMKSFIGKTVEAITLQTSKDLMASEADVSCVPRYMESLTDNYLKLRLRGGYEENRWVNIRIESVESGTLVGTLSDGCDVEDRTESGASRNGL
jgi:threonylcarbamoyladenosine tRNA methylthiotransferase MtaB